MLRDELWATITDTKTLAIPILPPPGEPFLFPLFRYERVDSFLCFSCIERRLGRQLTQADLNTSAWNTGWRNAGWFGPCARDRVMDETGRRRRRRS
jgi:hypothetical protein